MRFQNQRGVQSDSFGNAIIPSLSAYQENRIVLDTTTLPDDVDTNATVVTVVPPATQPSPPISAPGLVIVYWSPCGVKAAVPSPLARLLVSMGKHKPVLSMKTACSTWQVSPMA